MSVPLEAATITAPSTAIAKIASVANPAITEAALAFEGATGGDASLAVTTRGEAMAATSSNAARTTTCIHSRRLYQPKKNHATSIGRSAVIQRSLRSQWRHANIALAAKRMSRPG